MSGIAPARATRGPRAAAALLAAAAFAAVCAVAVGTEPGRRLDGAVLGAAGYETGSSLLGAVSVASLLLACAAVAVVATVRRRGDLGIAAVAVIVGSSALGRLLKQVVLSRPASDPGAGNSFPSGHMIAFAGVAAALLVVLPIGARLVVAALAAVVLPIVAVRLVHDGWHRPSDVLGSLLLVLATTAAATMWRAPAPPPRPRTHRRLEAALLVVAGLAGAVAGAAALVAAATGHAPWVLAAASLGLVAAVLAFLAATLRLLRLGRAPAGAA